MAEPLPISNRRWMDGFCWFARRMVRKQFAVFAVDDFDLKSHPIDPTAPLIVYANHPGWWDPIVGMLLCRELFPERSYFAPIDAEALKKYRSFRKLGYFGIDLKSTRGAADFLRTGTRVLGLSNTSLWITPEGRFTDPRDPQPEFMPGVAHLAMKHEKIACVPLAIEYAFVEEQQPFMLCRIGKPVQRELPSFEAEDRKDPGACAPRLHEHVRTPSDEKEAWRQRLETGLRDAQRTLADRVVQRDWSGFRVLLRSKRPLHGKGFG